MTGYVDWSLALKAMGVWFAFVAALGVLVLGGYLLAARRRR